MAKTYAIRPIRVVRDDDSRGYITRPLAAAQTFKEGAPVTFASGVFTEAGTDPSSIAGFATAPADGYAWMEDTFGTAVPMVPVAPADREFRGTLAGTYAASDIGTSYGLLKDASGYWVVDKSDTVNTRVTVTGVEADAEVGDTNVPVTFVVLPANRQVLN